MRKTETMATTETKATTETMARTETTAAMTTITTRATTMRGTRIAGRKVPYHRGEKNENCGFCGRELECTTRTMLYSHLGRYIFISIQTNGGSNLCSLSRRNN